MTPEKPEKSRRATSLIHGPPCPGCNGLGRYVGFQEVEDPCSHCGGLGVHLEGVEYGYKRRNKITLSLGWLVRHATQQGFERVRIANKHHGAADRESWERYNKARSHELEEELEPWWLELKTQARDDPYRWWFTSSDVRRDDRARRLTKLIKSGGRSRLIAKQRLMELACGQLTFDDALLRT